MVLFHAFKKKAGNTLKRIIRVALCVASFGAPLWSYGSETRFHPDILLSEEYNDNIFLLPENKVGDYITRIDPGITVDHTDSIWDLNLRYVYDYRRYAHASRGHDSSQAVHAVSRIRIVGDSVLLDIRDDYEKISLDVTRDYTQESNFINQTDKNILNINPHVLFRASPQTTINAGFNLIDTWYKAESGIDTTQSILSLEMLQDISPKSVLNSSVLVERNDNSLNTYTKKEIFLGPRFDFAEGSSAVFNIGYDWFSFERDIEERQPVWEINAAYRFSGYTASLETGKRYVADPTRVLNREDRYQAAIARAMERSSFTISGGLREYRQVGNDDLITRNRNLGIAIGYRVVETTMVSCSLSTDRVANISQENRKVRYLATARLQRKPIENLEWGIEYRFSKADSPTVPFTNYKSNRILIDITSRF